MAEVYKHRRFTGILPWEFDKEKIITRIVEEEGGKDIEIIGEELNSEEHSLSWEYGIMYAVISEEEDGITGYELLGEAMEGEVKDGERYYWEGCYSCVIRFEKDCFRAEHRNDEKMEWLIRQLKAKWKKVGQRPQLLGKAKEEKMKAKKEEDPFG